MSDRVLLTPVDPPGRYVGLWLVGQATQTGGTARWEVVNRPRRKGAPEYVGTDPWRLTLPCLLDGLDGQANRRGLVVDHSVEGDVDTLHRLARHLPGTDRPPILTVAGPVPLHGLRWVVESIEWGEHVRTLTDATLRTQQTVTVVLLEHTSADVFLGPAAQAQARQDAAPPPPAGAPAPAPAGAVRTYTVRAGDTLSKVAARELGNASRWPDLARLNALRDPNLIRVGQVLRLP